MRRLLIILAVLAGGVARGADEPPLPVLIVCGNGYYWMIAGADGRPVIYSFSQVIVLGQPVPPRPGPPDPDIPEGFGFTAKVRSWLSTVPESARGNAVEIRKAVESVAELLKSGKLTSIMEAEATLGVLLTAAIVDKAAWATFGKKLEDEIVKSTAIESPDDLVTVLNEIAKGLK